ncbi:phosphotransferase [Legionella sp. W05-934-2]|uniref:phosphotransferase n=1 Tax=Legionella sp. W05-934-2 TaxID=1198649 RepID=UPI003462B9AC
MYLGNPTWQSLSPGLPQYIPINNREEAAIVDIMPLLGQWYRVYVEGAGTNFFRFDDAVSKQNYFIKRINKEDYQRNNAANNIARWLDEQGVPTNYASKIIKQDKASYFFIYPLNEGQRVPADLNSMAKLGSSLATLHTTLKQLPKQDEIINKTNWRIELLEEVRKKLVNGHYQFGPNSDFVHKLAKKIHHPFLEDNCIQPLHGDLNYGNILYHNHAIMYLDFEDTLHSFLPTIFEIGYVLERFLFTKVSDKNKLLSLGKAFMKAYLSNNGQYIYHEHHAKVLPLLALRSFCVLTLCELEGKTIDKNEWLKFEYLAELGFKTALLFDEIIRT